jgi:hypothetical protein
MQYLIRLLERSVGAENGKKGFPDSPPLRSYGVFALMLLCVIVIVDFSKTLERR